MKLNPFDPHTVLLAKHAQHVVLIHFPIGLFLAGVLFDFLGRWTKSSALETSAYFNFLLAAISAIPVIATGLLAWQWALEGQELKGILLLHLILGWLSAAVLWAVWLLHRRERRGHHSTVAFFLQGLELLGVLIVAVTAHLGGFLSGVNAPN